MSSVGPRTLRTEAGRGGESVYSSSQDHTPHCFVWQLVLWMRGKNTCPAILVFLRVLVGWRGGLPTGNTLWSQLHGDIPSYTQQIAIILLDQRWELSWELLNKGALKFSSEYITLYYVMSAIGIEINLNIRKLTWLCKTLLSTHAKNLCFSSK